MKVVFYPLFQRSYKRLDRQIQLVADKRIAIFEGDPFDTRLHTHQLHGKLKNIWSFAVDARHRVLFTRPAIAGINRLSAAFAAISNPARRALRPMAKSLRSRKRPVYECMKVRFTLEALAHIAGIHFYIETKSRSAATRIVDRIFSETDRLSEFPRLGHVGVVAGAYERTVCHPAAAALWRSPFARKDSAGVQRRRFTHLVTNEVLCPSPGVSCH
jgi:plasmid stabilization system protein ParE/Txe/YoeB family toxin of Txe-Axe toxin-antitoxin module